MKGAGLLCLRAECRKSRIISAASVPGGARCYLAFFLNISCYFFTDVLK